MNILHATTEPPLLQRLKEMLGSSARADIAVGYPFDKLPVPRVFDRASFFVSGFEQVSAELGALKKVRILVGRTDRQVVEQVENWLAKARSI